MPKWALTYSREPWRPCSSPPQKATRIVRRGLAPIALRMRAASRATAQPAAVSLAPEAACQLSKWAPIMTTSSARSVPGISPRTFEAFSTFSPTRLRTSTSTLTGMSRLRMRYIRL